MKTFWLRAIFLLLFATEFVHAKEPPLKVAVIGGMVTSGMWERVEAAFEARYGIEVEVVISGNKQELDSYVREHQVDFITMHSSDTLSDLVADGLFEHLTPWTRNAQMLVGVGSNPANIAPSDTLPQALMKIETTKTPFLVHPSGGTFEVVSALKEHYNFHPATIFLESKRGFLKEVVRQNGYTLFGVIPFLLQKEHHAKIAGYYIEDKKLMRPYLAAIAHPSKVTKEVHAKAQKLLDFLTSKEAQEIVASYRMEGFEATPIFFAITPLQ